VTNETRRPGKTRTRQHVIADLAVNHVERQVLLCGYTAQRVQQDYGYDLTLATYDRHGQIEGGVIFVQVKATDDLPLLKDGKTISWPVSRRDLKLWLHENYPVLLVVYDGQRDRAYWLDVQTQIAKQPTADLFTTGATVNFHISIKSRVTQKAIEKIAQHKRRIHEQLRQRRSRHG
jgi:hypothetical protein